MVGGGEDSKIEEFQNNLNKGLLELLEGPTKDILKVYSKKVENGFFPSKGSYIFEIKGKYFIKHEGLNMILNNLSNDALKINAEHRYLKKSLEEVEELKENPKINANLKLLKETAKLLRNIKNLKKKIKVDGILYNPNQLYPYFGRLNQLFGFYTKLDNEFKNKIRPEWTKVQDEIESKKEKYNLIINKKVK